MSSRSNISFTLLKKISTAAIRKAGPRYTPSIDPTAPNLEIAPLLAAFHALAYSDEFRERLSGLGNKLQESWLTAPNEIRSIFDQTLHKSELCSVIVKRISLAAPGASLSQISALQHSVEQVWTSIREYRLRLEERRTANASDKEKIDQELRSLRKFQAPLEELQDFLGSPDCSLSSNNRLLLKGGWGTGKTHFLCDLTKTRLDRELPTLFFLGQSLPQDIDPLKAICQMMEIQQTPNQLLKALNELGKARNARALLIIDGINEGDRVTWRKYVKTISRSVDRFPNVGLVLSCRIPFDDQIFFKNARAEFVETQHIGFEDIEFDAQKEFFKFYQIPLPHIPLLAPEFSRPLFLKILCESVASLGGKAKLRRINDFAAGQKSMTKLLEDFIAHAGRPIEIEFKVPLKTCWRIIKGGKKPSSGFASFMANEGKDYITKSECISIVRKVLGLSNRRTAEKFLNRLTASGLLIEDRVWGAKAPIDVFRLPYQRFSDHLIARHLLSRHLKTDAENSIKRSFYGNRPLGKLLKTDQWGRYLYPGLISAVILEFPERVKRTIGAEHAELIFYLPRKERVWRLLEPFLEGLLWRDIASFGPKTHQLIAIMLDAPEVEVQQSMLEVLVCLASRKCHPCSAERLFGFLSKKSLPDRDLFWSEFLRSRHYSSAVYRVLDWIVLGNANSADEKTVQNLIWLSATFLTSSVRPLRDKATKSLVFLGEQYPQHLFEVVKQNFEFNDPYVPERLLAASFGVIMRGWAQPKAGFREAVVDFAEYLKPHLQGGPDKAPLMHLLMRDYAQGVVDLAAKVSLVGKGNSKRVPSVSRKSPIPAGNRISEDVVEEARAAIHMDFANYTVGGIVEGRAPYNEKHQRYRHVLRQISWRVLNLGYDAEKFKFVDREISSQEIRRETAGREKTTDRYGKKYSWIAFFEAAGLLHLRGRLKYDYEARISACDIDPSFPEKPPSWRPPIAPYLFDKSFPDFESWVRDAPAPDYRGILNLPVVDNRGGPWTLLEGYISEGNDTDFRRIFTFLRGLLIKRKDFGRLRDALENVEYPGNDAIPRQGEDHYLFAGEIGWSPRFGSWLRKQSNLAKAQLREAFPRTEHRVVMKPISKLTRRDRRLLEFDRYTEQLSRYHGAIDDNIGEGNIRIKVWRRVPGILVELPSWHFAWEPHHSVENDGGNPEYLAPALVEALNLRKIGGQVDLYDESGKPASLYREYNEGNTRIELLYIRRDLLKQYLQKRRRMLVWINWGERELQYNAPESVRKTALMQQILSNHSHIHRTMLVDENEHKHDALMSLRHQHPT